MSLSLVLLFASFSYQYALWPLADRDPQNTNYSPLVGLGATSWSINALQELSPISLTEPYVRIDAIGLDGMIIGSIGSENATFLFALAANGSVLFNLQLPGEYLSPVVVDAKGNIYTSLMMNNHSYYFYAVSPMGKVLWTVPTLLNLGLGYMGILPNGNLITMGTWYIVSLDSSTGSELWRKEVGQSLKQFFANLVVIDPYSGNSYFILHDYLKQMFGPYVNASVVGISMDGSSMWQTTIASELSGFYGILLQSDGTIVAQYESYFTALAPNGEVQWIKQFPSSKACSNGPTMDLGGIAADSKDNLYSSTGYCCLSFDKKAELRWSVSFEEADEGFVALMTPTLGTHTLFGTTGYMEKTSDGFMYQLDMNSGAQRTGVKFPGKQVMDSPILANNKVLYFVSQEFTEPFSFFLNSVLLP